MKTLFVKLFLLVWTASFLLLSRNLGKAIPLNYAAWAVPVFLLISILSELTVFQKWQIGKKIRGIPIEWHLLFGFLVVSFIVGQLSLQQEKVKVQWYLIGAWMAGIAVMVFWAIMNYSHRVPLRKFIKAHKWEILAVAAITILAFGIRVISIEKVPYPFLQDEAQFVLEAKRVNEGKLATAFAHGIERHPTFYVFLLSPLQKMLDVIPAQRLPSVIVGTLTVPLLYLFTRTLFGILPAFLSAIFLAGYHFHHHYSRSGMNMIFDPFLVLLSLFFAWRAIKNDQKSDFVLLGLSAGFSVFFYAGAKGMVPVLLLILFGFTVLRNPSFLRKNFASILLALLSFSVIIMPMAYFWFAQDISPIERVGDRGLFHTKWFEEQKLAGNSTVRILSEQLLKSVEIFVKGEKQKFFYYAPIPLVDRLSIILVAAGILFSLLGIFDARHLLLFSMFLFTVILGGALVIPPVSSHHLLITIPAIAIWAGIGLAGIGKLLFKDDKNKFIFIFVVIGLILCYNVWFYFAVYSKGSYYSDWDGRTQMAIVKHIKTLPEDTVVFQHVWPMMGAGVIVKSLAYNYEQYQVNLEDLKGNHLAVAPSPRMFIFLDKNRADELDELKARCPGGFLRTSNTTETVITSYELLNASGCLPEKEFVLIEKI